MFTGIIQSIGRIESVHALGGDDAGVRVQVDATGLDCDDIALGDSVAISGVCLTVVAHEAKRLDFDVSTETLRCTTGLAAAGREVNLEKALRFGDRLGGHLVSGHVDGVGRVVTFNPEGESYRLDIEAPPGMARFIAIKGSITVDGVSLTVNEVNGSMFSVNLIPHTLEVTTLKSLAAGAVVNLEVDVVARYLDRLMEGQTQGQPRFSEASRTG